MCSKTSEIVLITEIPTCIDHLTMSESSLKEYHKDMRKGSSAREFLCFSYFYFLVISFFNYLLLKVSLTVL